MKNLNFPPSKTPNGNVTAFETKKSGFLSVPAGLFLLVFALGGMGLWSLLRAERMRIETQLDLDRCVGQIALDFKRLNEFIETSNSEIKVTRAALAPGTALPPVRVALQTSLTVLVALQEIKRMNWKLRQAAWASGLECRKRSRLRSKTLIASSAPPLPWTRRPPDSLGPQALTFQPNGEPHESLSPAPGFEFWARTPALASAAQVRSTHKGPQPLEEVALSPSSWSAKWQPPTHLSPIRPSIF